MEIAKVNVEVRELIGKGPARRSRTAGKVPGILYGHKEPPVSLTVDPHALLKSLDKEKKRNTVFSLTVAGNGKTDQVTAMLRDVQIHPLSRRVVHIDFIRVNLDEEVRVTVPLVLLGTPVGVVDGGNLHQSLHEIPVAAKPAAIPTRIQLDVSHLKIGDALHVSDVDPGPGVRVTLDPKESLASVVAPRIEKVEEAQAAAAVPAEGAAATPAGTPAEGAAAPAAEKGAAAKKEGGGEKKGK